VVLRDRREGQQAQNRWVVGGGIWRLQVGRNWFAIEGAATAAAIIRYPGSSMLLSGRPSARLTTSGDFSSPRHAAANGSRLDWSPIPARIRQRGTRTASYPSRASNPGAGAGEASCKEIQFEGNFAGPNRAARMRSRRSSIARSNRPQARDGTGPGRPRISNRTWVQTGA
jgi:hypothetical protein